MCHHVHVRISAEERQSARRFSGALIPAYASIALALLAAAVIFQPPRQGELVAAARPASQHAEHAR